jgi:nucleotide-binding universal stress UspA family protein
MSGIVVGVTGSEHSGRVLEWAMREASHHQLPLEVMAVRHDQVRPATRVLWAIPTLPEDRSNEEVARTAVQEFVEKIAVEAGVSVPELRVSVTTGDPVTELSRASREADLLVVGSSAGGLGKLLAGKISDHVVHHSACPVVVIPETDDPSGSKTAS